MQNSLFASPVIAVTIASTQCAYRRRMAKLSWPGWMVTWRDGTMSARSLSLIPLPTELNVATCHHYRNKSPHTTERQLFKQHTRASRLYTPKLISILTTSFRSQKQCDKKYLYAKFGALLSLICCCRAGTHANGTSLHNHATTNAARRRREPRLVQCKLGERRGS